MVNFNITDQAARRIKELVIQEPASAEQIFLRISVNGGGCSGFQYKYEFTTNIDNQDQIFEKNDIKIAIDQISGELLDNCILDYIETLSYANFEIKNPNATSGCGCGNSFSI